MRENKNELVLYIKYNNKMILNNLNKKFSTLSRSLNKNSVDINKVKELNVDINKDLAILNEKVNKLVSLQEETNLLHKKFFDIKQDVFESADKFLSKHNFSNNLEFGKLSTYLDSNMDILTLINILHGKGGKEVIITLFKKIKMGSKIDINLLSRNSELLDFVDIKDNNERIMDSYSNIIKDIDSIEFNSDNTDIPQGGCLIHHKLYDLLENSFKYKQIGKPGKTDLN
jgi:hypothetical protein